jgi:hypothetical protein
MGEASEFREFLREFRVGMGKPASEAALRNAESELGFTMPEFVRSCYRICDGGHAKNSSGAGRSTVEVLSLETVRSYPREFFEGFWGYFPFIDNNDSNPVCVCCKSPLAGYVVLVKHDDAARLMSRSLETFFRSAIEYINSGLLLHTHKVRSDFDGPDRNQEDISIARRLIGLFAAGKAGDDPHRTDALRFSCDLLANENVDEIADLLNDEDHYVREHALRRLTRIPSLNATKVVRQFRDDFDAFVERCARRLRLDGIEASVEKPYGQKTIRISPGPIWLDMEIFYSERNRADIEDFVVERARAFLRPR